MYVCVFCLERMWVKVVIGVFRHSFTSDYVPFHTELPDKSSSVKISQPDQISLMLETRQTNQVVKPSRLFGLSVHDNITKSI